MRGAARRRAQVLLPRRRVATIGQVFAHDARAAIRAQCASPSRVGRGSCAISRSMARCTSQSYDWRGTEFPKGITPKPVFAPYKREHSCDLVGWQFVSRRAKITLHLMPAKPFRIVETPPNPPSADRLARTHHLSRREKATITKFVISVRSSKGTVKSQSVARLGSKRAAARKK